MVVLSQESFQTYVDTLITKYHLSILQIELRKNMQERDKSVLDLKVRIWVDNIHFQKS